MRTQFDIFPWNKSFEVGIELIDEQHQALVAIINKLATHVAIKNDPVRLEKILNELSAYARFHFKSEEAIWHAYLPDEELEVAHRATHDSFLAFIDKTQFENNPGSQAETYNKLVSFLVNWLAFHILESDRYLASICLAMQAGKPLAVARSLADRSVQDSKSVLCAALLHMIADLSELSFQLGFEVDQRQQAQASLSKALSFSRSLVNSMQDALLTLDRYGMIAEVNPALCEMTGFSKLELVGTSPPFPFWVAARPCQIEQAFERARKEQHFEFELKLQHKDGHLFPVLVSLFYLREEVDQFVTFAATVKDITEIKNLEKQQLQLSLYDPLTNLANRRLFYEQLGFAMEESQRAAKCFALAFIDLDHFKTLNDTLGHVAGDLILKEVAKRLKESVRAIDTVCRFGGDEFVVLLSDLNPPEARAHAEQIAQKIRAKIAEPLRLPGSDPAQVQRDCECTASIGVALSRGRQAGRDELLNQADQAMYLAKASGRDMICFHETED